ncbi:hypothetical protein Tco_0316184 [Tanacetum coccineum]
MERPDKIPIGDRGGFGAWFANRVWGWRVAAPLPFLGVLFRTRDVLCLWIMLQPCVLWSGGLVIYQALLCGVPVPKDKNELAALQERLRKRFPVDAFNKARAELDPNRILSNGMVEKMFPLNDATSS